MKGCRPLTNEEMELVAKTFGGRYAARDKALFVLGVSTGFRISELLSIRVRDVWQHGRFVDEVTVDRKYMKGENSSRTVELDPVAKAALSDWLPQLWELGYTEPDSFVFQSQRSKKENKAISYRAALFIIQQAFEMNELTGNLATHTMRKTFARSFVDNYGPNIFALSDALGHADISTTQRYYQVDRKGVRRAILSIWDNTSLRKELCQTNSTP